MINKTPNFLSKKDCEAIIKMIDSNHTRSSVAGAGNKKSVYEETRTSSTSNLDVNDPLIKRIKKRIAKKLGLNLNQGESIQGQLYEPGQYFKPHTDWFSGDSYINHCLSSGNRIHTLMVYLNIPEEGGETDFPEFKMKVKPKIGLAIDWPNMINGETLDEVLHEGTEVKKGKKYIITSWWRENEWNGHEDTVLAAKHWEEKNQPTAKVTRVKAEDIGANDLKIFSTKEDLPQFHPMGFEVTKVPSQTWGIIQDAYQLLQNHIEEETWQGVKDVIGGGGNEYGSEMMSFDKFRSIQELIHRELQPIHEAWAKQPLIPTSLYGIRSYKRGASLINHTDRVQTHHISSIIIVDKNLACGCGPDKQPEDWALDFQTHDGQWHKIYAEPGDMILYESATCMHGRPDVFKGTFFRNFYVHYKLKDWTFQPLG